MAKATLSFDLSDPDDNNEFQILSHAHDVLRTLEDIKSQVRAKLKYADLTEEQDTVWEEVSKMIWESIEEHGIEKVMEL